MCDSNLSMCNQNCTGEVCVLGGEGRSHFCRDTPCSIEVTAHLYVPLSNPVLHLSMPHAAPQPCRSSMAEHVLPLAELGQDCLNSNGYGQFLRNVNMSAWTCLHVPWMNLLLILWRS